MAAKRLVRRPPTPSVHIRWTDGDGREHGIQFSGRAALIGRSSEADVQLADQQASWEHARIVCDSGSIRIVDLGSSNGTWVRDERLTPGCEVPLAHDETVTIGRSVLRATLDGGNGSVEQAPQVGAPAGPILVGRASDAAIRLSDPSVSWHHAMVTARPDGWLIEDLQSSNGTFVNGKRISRCVVGPDDVVRVGQRKLSLTAEGSRACGQESISLEVSHLSHSVDNGGKRLTLLSDISFVVNPGELVAVLGASGSGKTTLLLALSGYQPARHGRVLINGSDLYDRLDEMKTAIGYVPQADIVHMELRLDQALRFAARLRLPQDTREREVEELVETTLQEMDLLHRRSTRIGSLSGGERKRANIAVELLTRPSLLFLDEPTSGLDAGLGRRITSLLRRLADEGRTVITVTHALEGIEEYDKVVVLAQGGRLAFVGSPAEAQKFFGVKDFVAMYDVVSDPKAHCPTLFAKMGGAIQAAYTPHAPISKHARPRTSGGSARQFSALLSRYLQVVLADTKNLVIWALQVPVIALALIAIFSADTLDWEQVADDTGRFSVQDAPTMLFLMAVSIACFGLFNSAREIVKERRIYDRERHVGLRLLPYIASKVVLLSVVGAIQVVLILAIVSFKVDFGLTLETGAQVLGLLFLGSLNAILLGLLISAGTSNPDQAITLSALGLLGLVVFSGLVPLERLNSLQILANACSLRWTYGGLCSALELPKRWDGVGLGSLVQDLHRTSVQTAQVSLIVLAVVTACALTIKMHLRKQRNVR